MSEEKQCHTTKKSHHSEKLKSNLNSRLNRIEGQVKAIRRQIHEDVYCDEVLNLLSSVQSALNSVGSLLLEHHIKSCVVDQIAEGQVEVIDELMKTIKKLTK